MKWKKGKTDANVVDKRGNLADQYNATGGRLGYLGTKAGGGATPGHDTAAKYARAQKGQPQPSVSPAVSEINDRDTVPSVPNATKYIGK